VSLRVRVRSAEAVAEEEESSHRGGEEKGSDDVFHACIVSEGGGYVKPKTAKHRERGRRGRANP
tara:strand:- start:140 stop:331 length:192 start_codon:yes stop_codon:yes gene_type:complete